MSNLETAILLIMCVIAAFVIGASIGWRRGFRDAVSAMEGDLREERE